MEVYSTADRIRLTLNGKPAGEKRVPASCRVLFRVPYEPGELRAEALDAQGRVTGSDRLISAGAETILRLEPETGACRPGEMIYLRIRYTDRQGVVQPLARRTVRVSAENGTVMGTANGCTFFRGNYAQSKVETYFGEAQAVVRAEKPGILRVTVTDGQQTATAEITCKE